MTLKSQPTRSVEDVLKEPEVVESLKKVALNLVQFHKEHGDKDATAVNVTDWDQTFIDMIRDPLVLKVFAGFFEDNGCVVGLDMSDRSVIMIADAEYISEQEEHSLNFDINDFTKFIEEVPEEEQSEAIKAMVVNHRKPSNIN